MNVQRLFQHHGIRENPFSAEEARHDPIFERLVEATSVDHPDFDKLMGQVDRPSTAVAFGEKGSGKTALRISMERILLRHNREEPRRRVLVVPYDDLNPFLDNLLAHNPGSPDEALRRIRLVDHQDAILSLAVTQVVDGILGEQREGRPPMLLPEEKPRLRKRLSRATRIDLALLAAVYDQPEQGPVRTRWRRLRSKLGGGWGGWLRSLRAATALLLVAAAAGGVWAWLDPTRPFWVVPSAWAALVLGVAGLVVWAVRNLKVWKLARAIERETPVIQGSEGELRKLLAEMSPSELDHRPLPAEGGASDNRYQLTRRLLRALSALDHVGMTVLFDRVDEPTAVSGDPERMRSIVWPLFDNKFLEQDGVGIKLLLPMELRYLLNRESSEFFQEARLDKQNVVQSLNWTGAILYDLCNRRLNACREEGTPELSLLDLFDDDVEQRHVVEALDQMGQPRDAIKFLYAVIQEHCRLVPDDREEFRIPRITLESVRKGESQRVQELARGVTPA